MLLFLWSAHAATITSNNVTGNWNAASTWIGGVVPGAGDDVVINASATITVTANTSCVSITWTGNPSASRTLTINSGVTLNVSGNITLGTTTTNNRTRTINVIGTLNCGGSFTMQASGQDTRDIILTIATTGQVTIGGDLIMESTFARHHIDMTGNAQINIAGNVGANAAGSTAGGGFTNPPSGSIINLNGTLPQNYFTNNDPTYSGILKINNPSGVTFRKATNLGASTLTIGDITPNSLLKDSGFTITASGTLNLINGSTLQLGRVGGTGGTSTVFPSFGTRNIALGTTVHYAHANNAQTISTAPQYANLLLSTTSNQNKTIAAGTLTVRQNLTIEANTNFNGTNSPTVNIGGNFSNSGSFNSGTGLYTMNGTSDQEITSTTALTFNGGFTISNSGGAIVRNNNAAITIPSGDVFTITNGAIFYAGNNVISGAGTFTLASGGTLGIGAAGGIAATGTTGNVQTTTRNFNTGANYIYNGIVNQTEGTGLPANVNALTINNTGTPGNNTVTMESNVTVATNLSVLSGILDLATFTANRGSAGGTLTLSNDAGLEIGGTNTLPANYSTHVIGPTSTVTYKGTTNTIAALNSSQSYGNLVVSASGAVTTNNFGVSRALTVTGSLIANGGTVTMNNPLSSIANSGTLEFNGLTISATPTSQTQYNTSFSVGGTLTVPGGVVFAPSGGTITLSGNSASVNNSGTLTFNNLTVSGSNVTSTGNFAVNNTMQVSGTFNPGAATVVSGTGTLNGSGTVNVTRIIAVPSFGGQYTLTNKTLSNLTVNYTGAGAQTVSAADYSNLVISPNGTRTVTLVNGGTIRVSNTFTPATTNTTYIVTGNTFEYNGAGAQTITAFSYNDLIISNNGAKTILAGTTVKCKTITMNDAAVLTLPTNSVLDAELF